MATNPWAEIDYLDEKPRERLITEEEFAHMLANCTNGNVRGGAEDMKEQLKVLRYTTMRPQELRLLKWDYIHWDDNRIVFPSTVVKTRKRREATMIEQVKVLLAERKKRTEAMGLRITGRYVFPLPGKLNGVRQAGVGDAPLNADKLSKRFKRLLNRCVAKGLIEKEKAGEELIPYSTRHTRITELFTEGNDHAVVMFDAGHTNPLTTERYKHLAGSHVSDAIRRRDKSEPRNEGSAG